MFSFLLISSKDSKEYALHDDTVAACMFNKCPGQSRYTVTKVIPTSTQLYHVLCVLTFSI